MSSKIYKNFYKNFYKCSKSYIYSSKLIYKIIIIYIFNYNYYIIKLNNEEN